MHLLAGPHAAHANHARELLSGALLACASQCLLLDLGLPVTEVNPVLQGPGDLLSLVRGAMTSTLR